MKKLLHIVASPRGEKSRTLRVAHAFLERFHGLHPDWLIDEINLFHETLPPLTARRVDGKYLLLGGKGLYGELRETWEEIKQQIARFKEADAYLISTPMWNFGMPYVLKQYIDILVQPQLLFHYVDGRPEGFLKGRRMLVISSRGGAYTSAETASFDHLEPHLRAVFGLTGITDIEFINVEPLDGVPAEAERRTVEAACLKAQEAAKHFPVEEQ
jgi:FMN-dependent NADH-azoreductase